MINARYSTQQLHAQTVPLRGSNRLIATVTTHSTLPAAYMVQLAVKQESIHRSIDPSIHRSIHPSIHPFIHSSIKKETKIVLSLSLSLSMRHRPPAALSLLLPLLSSTFDGHLFTAFSAAWLSEARPKGTAHMYTKMCDRHMHRTPPCS